LAKKHHRLAAFTPNCLGIPIPAKFCEACHHAVVDIDEKFEKCPKCGGNLEKDPDTFDTGFLQGNGRLPRWVILIARTLKHSTHRCHGDSR